MIRSIRIYITEKCNANCPTCFNSNSRTNAELSFQKFEKICNLFSQNGIEHIKIMGGEPTIHPLFNEFILYAQSKFKYVHVFTNAINDIIINLRLREDDCIVYNFAFSKCINSDKLLLQQPGKRALEIQIGVNTHVEHLLNEILRVYSLATDKVTCVLTMDCTENIFKNKSILREKYLKIWKYCQDNKIPLYQDHKIPLCWLAGTGIPVLYNDTSICDIQCAGLIDAQGNLKHCNQFPEPLINIFDNEKILPYEIICNYIKLAHHNIAKTALEKICISCIFYGSKCNGGCFISKSKIYAQDIINNSIFPK